MRAVASNSTVSPDSLAAVTWTVRGVEPSLSVAMRRKLCAERISTVRGMGYAIGR
jgi:hypothetical protein